MRLAPSEVGPVVSCPRRPTAANCRACDRQVAVKLTMDYAANAAEGLLVGAVPCICAEGE